MLLCEQYVWECDDNILREFGSRRRRNLEHIITHIGWTKWECQKDYSRLSGQLADNGITAVAGNGVCVDVYSLRF
jgi:hypothetical protein